MGFFLIGELLIQSPMLGVGISDNIDTFLFNNTIGSWEAANLPSWFGKTDLITIIVMLTFMIINMLGIKGISYLNIAACVFCVISLVFFCVLALVYGDPANLHSVVNPKDGRTGFSPYGMNGILSGAAIAFFAFVGLESVVTLAEESVDPKRDLPRAIGISFVIVMILYVTTAFSIAYFVPWFEISGTTGLVGSLQARGNIL